MPRATNAPASHKRKKRILKKAKGFRGSRSKLFRTAKDAVTKSQQWAYRDRKNRKRTFRRLWIARINAAARLNGVSYSRLIGGLKQADVRINRKMLAQMAMADPSSFTTVVNATQG